MDAARRIHLLNAAAPVCSEVGTGPFSGSLPWFSFNPRWCAVEKNGISLNSALSEIARHERKLLTQDEESAREAERIVAQARTEAGRIAESEAASLALEVARIRQEAEQARADERLRHQVEAQRKLEQLRDEAKDRAKVAVQKVVSLVLPPPTRGSQ